MKSIRLPQRLPRFFEAQPHFAQHVYLAACEVRAATRLRAFVLALALDIPDPEFFSAERVRTSACACKLACVRVRVRVRTCTRACVRVVVCTCVLEILPPPQILNFRRPLTPMHNVESMASCKHGGRKINFATRSCSQH